MLGSETLSFDEARAQRNGARTRTVCHQAAKLARQRVKSDRYFNNRELTSR